MDKARLARVVLALILVGVPALVGCGRIQVSVEKPTPAEAVETVIDTPPPKPTSATILQPMETPAPSPTDTPQQIAKATNTAEVIAATPAPTVVPPTPAPSPTPVPLPSVEEVLRRYNEEIQPLVEKLQAAQESPPDFQLPPATEWQIILVPLSDRLYYVQTLLFPKWTAGEPDAPVNTSLIHTSVERACIGVPMQPHYLPRRW
ncbi:MAG: hypothetical protein ACE5LU_02950 [Anaerolineae bacterium]